MKGYFNEVVSFELSKITAQKDSGIERFTLDKKQAIDIYELCIKYEVFSEPPISEIDFLKCFDAINEISIYPKFATGKAGYFHYILSKTVINQKQVFKQLNIKNYNDLKSKANPKVKNINENKKVLDIFKRKVDLIFNKNIILRH